MLILRSLFLGILYFLYLHSFCIIIHYVSIFFEKGTKDLWSPVISATRSIIGVYFPNPVIVNCAFLPADFLPTPLKLSHLVILSATERERLNS